MMDKGKINKFFCIQDSAIRLRSGQAMIEFCVGMVAIMAILVTLLQVVSISRIRTELMAEARETAGEESLAEFAATGGADYIEDWEPGPDEVRYSADDTYNSGNPLNVQTFILDYSVSDPDDWQTMYEIPNNPFAEINAAADPAASFGLVNSQQSGSVDNNGAFRRLVYDSETIEFEVNAWMTWTTGFY